MYSSDDICTESNLKNYQRILMNTNSVCENNDPTKFATIKICW